MKFISSILFLFFLIQGLEPCNYSKLSVPVASNSTHIFYVHPEGKASNTGTKKSPFGSIEHVFDRINTSSREEYNEIIVEVADGIYPTESIELSPKINGAMDTKITIRAENRGNVVLDAGKTIPLADFKVVNEKEFSKRIQTHLKDSIVFVKLSDLGIRNIRQYADVFDGNGGLIQLFYDGKRMPLSEYPNPIDEKMTIKDVLVNGGGQEKPGSWSDFYKDNEVRRQLEINPPRPSVFTYKAERKEVHARWAKAMEMGVPVWMNGFWRVMWENSTVRIGSIDTVLSKVSLSVPVKGGIGSKYHRPGASGQEVYKVVNLLEEIDYPGEWSFDFASQCLFFYPTKQNGTVTIAHNLNPVLNLQYMSNVTLEGLVFEGSLGNGVEIKGGRNNKILGCTVRKIGNDGIVINGGFGHEVRSSDLYDLGGAGIWLSGGMEDSTPRVAAKHRIVNNHIHHFAKVRRVYAAGINCGFEGGGGGGHYPAVGNYISHNLIHTTPHVGILHGSFDNVFEYNEVYDWSKVSNDMGAIYCYSHYPYIEGTVVRYNFIHSSSQGDGIYFDHNMDGAEVYGNILFNIGSNDEHGRGTAFLIKNGDKDKNHDRIKIYNNIALETKFAYYARLTGNADFYNNVAVNSMDTDFELFFHEETDAEPVKNPKLLFGKNKAYKKDVGFIDYKNLDLNLKNDAQLFMDFPGFQSIPFNKIGLFTDEYRKEVKNEHRNLTYLKSLTKGGGAYAVEDRD